MMQHGMAPYESDGNPYSEPDVVLEEELQEPRLYRVLLHNDNYTTMEFVIGILVEVFHKSVEQAATIMLSVHENGIGVCGVYPHEVAETKVAMVHNRARRAGFPLKSTMEEVG
jgi:ATP-dependent Clp protease adaptor protein ClpS